MFPWIAYHHLLSKPYPTNLDFGEDNINCDDVQLFVVQSSVADKQAIEYSLTFKWGNGIWNESYMNCGYEIKWSYDLRSWLERRTGIARYGFKPRGSPEFFRLLYAIVKIAFITAKIIASLEYSLRRNLFLINGTLMTILRNCRCLLLSLTIFQNSTKKNSCMSDLHDCRTIVVFNKGSHIVSP